jgi:hypothetical protein
MEESTQTKEITTQPAKVSPGRLSVSQEIRELKRIVNLETEKRKIMTKYVRDSLIDGVDYGSIKGTSKTGASFNSKKGLFKPGAEKLCSLFHLTPKFEKDNDTWIMFGGKQGVVAFVCRLYNTSGEAVSEGRGVGTMAESGATENKVVKIAQKRAQVDAVIRFAALSDVFSQDLETISPDELSDETGNKALSKNQPKIYPATPAQLTKIAILLKEKGKDKGKIYNHYGVTSLTQLSFKQASATIQKLDSYQNETPSAPDVESVVNADPSEPAQNFQIAWVKTNFDKLKQIGAIKKDFDAKMIDFISDNDFKGVKDIYDKYVENYNKTHAV